MNVKELNGRAIKKALGAQRVMFRWHNKNKSGGNFGINILGVNNGDWEISGHYDTNGNILSLRFGKIYQAGMLVSNRQFDELMSGILIVTKGVNS